MPLDAAPTTPRTARDTVSAAELIELLTVTDLAALLKVSKSWVYEHTRSRGTPRSDHLPHIKIGKYVRFDPELVRAFLDRQTTRR
jgi:excisionase family DNA binding protein